MGRSRTYSYLSTLLTLSLALTVMMPLAQHACAMMDVMAGHSAPSGHSMPEMPPCHSEDSVPDEVPSKTAAMPCCVLVAVGAPIPSSPTLETATTITLPILVLASQTSRSVPSATISPPGPSTPLHIVLGRFLI